MALEVELKMFLVPLHFQKLWSDITTASIMIHKKKITYDFIANLTSLPNCTIIPPGRIENPDLYSPYVVQAAFKNIPGNVMVRALDSKGFCISTGSACSTKKNNRPVLEAMKVSADLRETSVRFSFGPKTTANGVKELFEAVKDVYKQFNNLEK